MPLAAVTSRSRELGARNERDDGPHREQALSRHLAPGLTAILIGMDYSAIETIGDR
jgi:hypothetical protein